MAMRIARSKQLEKLTATAASIDYSVGGDVDEENNSNEEDIAVGAGGNEIEKRYDDEISLKTKLCLYVESFYCAIDMGVTI